MTFQQHLKDMTDRNRVFSYEDTAQSAWDAALCAVQAKIFDGTGKPKTPAEVSDILSNAHSWATQQEVAP